MNAVDHMLDHVSRAGIRRLADVRRADEEAERAATLRRYGGDLTAFLNRLHRAELDAIALALGMDTRGRVGELRKRVWDWGATAEAGGPDWLGTSVQPEPRVLRGKLVFFKAHPGIAPGADAYPREVPVSVPPPQYSVEPETLEQLLDRASSLVGLRMGERGKDKGAHGARIAALLGVIEDGFSEPDWRGEVEIKTVPVVRDAGGLWWVKEDPAISMETARPMAKLERVLWVARIADEEDSPILSWFYQELGDGLVPLVYRDLHTRPKGGKGATTRGWYLHKRFFIDCGLLLSLNG